MKEILWKKVKCDKCLSDPDIWTYWEFLIIQFWEFISDFTSSTLMTLINILFYTSIGWYLWMNGVDSIEKFKVLFNL